MSEESSISSQKARAILMLLAGRSQRETAAAVGVTEQTLSRWRHQDAQFEQQYKSGLQNIIDAGLTELLTARREAIHFLRTVVTSAGTCSNVDRIRAARAILAAASDIRPGGPTTTEQDKHIQRLMRLVTIAGFSGSSPYTSPPAGSAGILADSGSPPEPDISLLQEPRSIDPLRELSKLSHQIESQSTISPKETPDNTPDTPPPPPLKNVKKC